MPWDEKKRPVSLKLFVKCIIHVLSAKFKMCLTKQNGRRRRIAKLNQKTPTANVNKRLQVVYV